MTDDGALSHALMSPSRHVSKVYEAELDGMLVPDAAERFGAGLTLRDGTVCRPALLELLPGHVLADGSPVTRDRVAVGKATRL